MRGVVALLVMWIAAASAEPCLPQKAEWSRCKSDNDCYLHDGVCAPAASNAKFKKDVEHNVSCLMKTVDCMSHSDDGRQSIAVCTNGQCAVKRVDKQAVGLNPEWKKCTKDNECEMHLGVCSKTASHKKFLKAATEYYRLEAMRSNCAPDKLAPQNEKAICHNHACEVVFSH